MQSPVWNLLDIIFEVLRHCDLASVKTFGSLNLQCKSTCGMWLRYRLREILKAYFPEIEVYNQFIAYLTSSRGAIMGSITLDIVCASTYNWVTPKDLNIVVPVGEEGALSSFLIKEGFELGDTRLETKRKKTTKSHRSFEHRGLKKNVTVSESITESVLTVIFSAATSATMNLITASQIACFYPHLTMNGLSVGGYRKPTTADVITQFLRGWNLTKRTEMYSRPCGLECPSRERRVRGLRGITLVNWRETELNENFETRIEHMHYSWSTGYHCRNRECPYCIFRHVE